MLVRYKDLRAETLETLKHIHSTLEIPVGKRELARVIESRSFENIPEEKGEDTIRHKATPRGWSEDLTPEQIEIVEREAAHILNEFDAEGWCLILQLVASSTFCSASSPVVVHPHRSRQ